MRLSRCPDSRYVSRNLQKNKKKKKQHEEEAVVEKERSHAHTGRTCKLCTAFWTMRSKCKFWHFTRIRGQKHYQPKILKVSNLKFSIMQNDSKFRCINIWAGFYCSYFTSRTIRVMFVFSASYFMCSVETTCNQITLVVTLGVSSRCTALPYSCYYFLFNIFCKDNFSCWYM